MALFESLDLVQLAQDSLFSLERVAVGLAAATVLGVAFGLVRSALPERLKRNLLFRFLVEAPKFPPPIAWIPLVILGFGIGETAAYIIVFIGAFAPIFIAAYDGAESTPFVWRELAASMQLPRGRYLSRVVFMGALPQIFVGLRAGVSMAWMSVIAAEMISGQSGLGYAIQLHRLNLQYDALAIDMVAIGFIGFLLFEATVIAERVLIPWHERAARR